MLCLSPFTDMKTNLTNWVRRVGALAVAASGLLVFSGSTGVAAPDYDQIGRQFSLVLQNAHFSRARFSSARYQQFLECYLQTLDPQRVIFTQEDADNLAEKYAANFGDYLLAGKTTVLAEDLYGLYTQRSLEYLNAMESMVKAQEGKVPAFDQDRTIPRTRRKLPRAKDSAELKKVWEDHLADMMLSEVIRRENVAKLAAEKGKPDPNAKERSVHEMILARLKRKRAELQEADREDMVSTLLNAVAHVYDPHSDYMGAREEQLFKDQIKASIVGIGARLQSSDDGSTTIEGLVKGGPAAKCGKLSLGDRIVAVDSNNDGTWTDIMFMGIDKVVDLIRGKKGVNVGLRVTDADSTEERVVVVTRDEIPMSEELASARIVEMKAPGTNGEPQTYRLGILTLPSFYVDLDHDNVHCAADVKSLLRRMNNEGVQGIIIDLRFNGGGSLDEVRKMVGFFTGAGPVVQVKDSRGLVKRETVSSSPIFKGELVVLTNRLSASASEIFAGAMADYGRAVIMGDKTTFGKGTVQVPRSIADYLPYFSSHEGCGMIKVTTHQFYRVNGASTQLKGVESDIVVPQVTAGFRIGESEMDYALPYDEITRASSYVQDPTLAKIMPELQKRSAQRVAADKDMQYVQEDVNRAVERLEKNEVSLSKTARKAESEELLLRKREMDAECKQRYEQLAEQDQQNLTIYRLNLSDVSAEKLPLSTKEDKTSYMEENEDPEEELSKSPEYPSGLDPVLREGLYVLRDMIDLH